MFSRISIDPKVCHGQACIKGTRIPVHQIVLMLANGDTIEDLLESYPSITREDVLACLEYAGALAEEQVAPEVSKKQNVPIDEIIAASLAQKLFEIIPDPYLEQRANRATGEGVTAILSQVPDVPPEEYDKLD